MCGEINVIRVYKGVVFKYSSINCFLISPLDDLANRPKLNLKPRSVDKPVSDLVETDKRSAIFGGGKPRDDRASLERKD